MKKVKYFYNTHTLRYEKLAVPLRVKLLKVFGFFAAVAVTSAFLLLIIQKFFPSANERLLQSENEQLKYQLKVLNTQVAEVTQRINAVEHRDNRVYRDIFEAAPLPDSARTKMTGQIAELQKVGNMNQNQLVKSITTWLP